VPLIPVPRVEPAEPERDPNAPQPAISRCEGLIVQGETREEFNQFSERLDDHYMPFNYEERVSVGRLAECRWFLRRRRRVFESIETELYATQPDPSKWSEADFKRLALADSYRMKAEKAVWRAYEDVEGFLRQRIADYRFETNRDIAVRRLELQKRRFELAARVVEMRERRTTKAGHAVKGAVAS
jgi:hypothetical protein